ncbi:hypothetical protein RHGRI_001171 [Rhododendron griersonianum]|uniref:Uncharacterized protein n=1 Tax=Rhododendron griersonianum TaxID=479676 RepID=A0AAV6LMS9_9ERIC|nr:hypothetical protein RHGRI_001171 [Rhododendron griersonianum]
MASVTMTASFLGGATLPGGSPATTATHRRSLVIIRSCMAKSVGGGGKISQEISKNDQSSSSGRRDLVFAAAAAAVCSAAGVAVAEEPKRGTPVARKIYAPMTLLPSLNIFACYAHVHHTSYKTVSVMVAPQAIHPSYPSHFEIDLLVDVLDP